MNETGEVRGPRLAGVIFYSNYTELWVYPRRMSEERDNLSHRKEQLTISNRVEVGVGGIGSV